MLNVEYPMLNVEVKTREKMLNVEVNTRLTCGKPGTRNLEPGT
jgi:hypothetical protein